MGKHTVLKLAARTAHVAIIPLTAWLLSACIAASPNGNEYQDNIMVGDSIVTPKAKIVLLDIQVMIGQSLRAKVGITWKHTGEYEEHLLGNVNATRSPSLIRSPDRSVALQIAQEEPLIDWKDTRNKDRKSVRLRVKEMPVD